MFFLIFLALVKICYCLEQYNYHADQRNATLRALPENKYINLTTVKDGYPTEIEYLAEISADTGLMVRVVFGGPDGPLDAKNTEDTRINLCDILNDQNSSRVQYHMAEFLGLVATRCPIGKGVKAITPYEFPTEFTTEDLGCGDRYIEITVETTNQDLQSEAILNLRASLKVTKTNDTCTEPSSSTLLVPSVITSLIVTSFLYKFNN